MADGKKIKQSGWREADRLDLLRSCQVLDAEPVGVFDDAVMLAAQVCEASVATIAFFETRRQWFKARLGVDLADAPLEGSLNALVVKKNDNLLIIDDVVASEAFSRDPVVRVKPELHFYAGALLMTKEGQALGVLSVFGDAPRPNGLDPKQKDALLAIAGGVVREIEGRRAGSRSGPSQVRGASATKSPTLSREMTSDQVQKALLLAKTVPWEISLPADRLVLGENARELLGLGTAVNMPRFREHIHPDDQALFEGYLHNTMSGSPGEIEVRFRRTRGKQVWLRVHAEMLSHFSLAGTFVDITDEKRAALGDTSTDYLTGLMTRGAFQEALQRELRNSRAGDPKVAVLLIDIDRLEEVNETFGRHVGDEVLREAGRRIEKCLGARGKIGRARDDEFIVMLKDVSNGEETKVLGERLLSDLRAPFTYQGVGLSATASLGATLVPGRRRDLGKVLHAADAALNAAKNSGRDQVAMATAEDARELDRRERERQAIRIGRHHNDIRPFYQPVYDLRTGKLVSLEALARWRHPSRGLLAADFFQSVFEDAQAASDVTEAMLGAIGADQKTWRADGVSYLRVSLNLSESEVRQKEASKRILEAMGRFALSPRDIEIEMSEASLMRRNSCAQEIASDLRSHGVRVAIDNFGRTFGSLSSLRGIEFDHLKLDRCLLGSLDSDVASRCIIDAAKTLCAGLQVDLTVEGIETVAQLEHVRAAGCSNGQGYLLGAPMPGWRVPELLRRLDDVGTGGDPTTLDAPDPFLLPGMHLHTG